MNRASKMIGFLFMFLAAAVAAAQDGQPAPGAVQFKTLVNFIASNGAWPSAAVVQGPDGNLYGTTTGGGDYYSGNVFQMTPSGALTVIYNSCALTNCYDGAGPNHLVLGSDGNLYGTTLGGGANFGVGVGYNGGPGTFFQMTTGGALTVLYNFCSLTDCNDGDEPNGIVMGADGNFYGTSPYGGPPNPACGESGCGVVFRITPQGGLSRLHTFCSQVNCADGAGPLGTVIQGTDGNFYGTATYGGVYGGGTVFKMSREGALTTLYSFCAETNCTDGSGAYGSLVQAANGRFYGTTEFGGLNQQGTVFEITAAGALKTTYGFCTQTNCTDGIQPAAPLIQATDGNLYGSTTLGGGVGECFTGLIQGCGTVFKVTPEGILTTVHNFDESDGWLNRNGLFQSTSGVLYGAVSNGGRGFHCEDGCGTVFGMNVGLGPFVETVPASGRVGDPINILGNSLTEASGVTFDGIAAVFATVSDSLIVATVPSGATSGLVKVSGASGTLRSTVKFQVQR